MEHRTFKIDIWSPYRANGFGSTPEIWLQMQAAYDVAQAQKHADAINVQRYSPVQSATSQPVFEG